MKNLKIFFLALGVYSTVFSQIPEIKRLPVQDISQSIQESTPVWISENEIIIFYLNESKDTLFQTRSTNSGINWQQPKVVQVVSVPIQQTTLDLTSLRTSAGRILFAWSISSESMKLIYSDDRGNSWSQPISILGGGSPQVVQRSSRDLNLSQWKTGEICLSFTGSGVRRSYYKLSSDDGATWSVNPFDFSDAQIYSAINLSIHAVSSDTLLAVYEQGNFASSSIFSRKSTDHGLTWSDPQLIAEGNNSPKEPKVSTFDNGNFIVVYLRSIVNQMIGEDDADIFYKISSDGGLNWSEEKRFTKYIGKDSYINLTSFQDKVFITFATERFSVSRENKSTYQTAYGILEESIERFTPPKVYNAYVPLDLIDEVKKEFVYRALVIDDEAVHSVTALIENGIYTAEMFDDGLHNDGAANDSIFANTFPFIQERYLEGYALDVNKIELPLNNKGVLAAVNVAYGQQQTVIAEDFQENQATFKGDLYFYGYGSNGKFDEGSFLFSGGFMLSGYSNGEMWSNAVATASLVQDYLAGKIGSLPDDPKNVLYVVNKSDPVFGTSWQRWKDAVDLGAEFYDGDKDGFYNPVDKNRNGTWDLNEDMPMLIGNEIIWCVYNDGLPQNQRRWSTVGPQGIEMRQTIFATDNQELENVIFIRYSILNTGNVAETMDSVYFGIYEDGDLGDFTDDVIGCDTLLNSGFIYNNTHDAVYGDNCPAFFSALLQGPIVNSISVSDTAVNNFGQLLGSSSFQNAKNLDMYAHTFYINGIAGYGDPNNAIEARNVLLGLERDGQIINPCTFIYGQVRGGVNCNDVNPLFLVSGDPVSDVGWICSQSRDMRNVVSTGPFKLEKDKPQEIIIAYVIGRGTDYFNSITVARENVQRAIQEYQSNFASMTYTAPPPIPVNDYVLYQNFPNPFNPTTTIRYDIPQDGKVTIEVFDILGQRVGTLVNEFQKADRYEITMNSAGLASGVYIYQLRVNNFITSKKMLLVK